MISCPESQGSGEINGLIFKKKINICPSPVLSYCYHLTITTEITLCPWLGRLSICLASSGGSAGRRGNNAGVGARRPRPAFPHLMGEPWTHCTGLHAVPRHSPTFRHLSFIPPGMFFPQISTWVALKGRREGRGGKNFRRRACCDRKNWAESPGTRGFILGSGCWFKKLTSSQIPHNL